MDRTLSITIAIIVQFFFIIRYLKGATGLLIASIYGFVFAVLYAHFFAPQYTMALFWWGAGILAIIIPLYYCWYYFFNKNK